jgi:hypothetical protein
MYPMSYNNSTYHSQFLAQTPLCYILRPITENSIQLADKEDTSPNFSEVTERLQQIVGKFLYYVRVVETTMLTAIHKLKDIQAHPTEAIRASIQRFIAYASTWPNAE